MSLQGELPAPAANEFEIDQVLLGLADGSYVLSAPDGSVAKCGVGVVALFGSPAERLVGRPTMDILLSGADADARAAFERLPQAEGAEPGDKRTFRTATASGAELTLEFVVVAVPLALGWEFTSLLSELGSRDTGTWEPQALRMRHGRALEAIESVCSSGAQPDPGGPSPASSSSFAPPAPNRSRARTSVAGCPTTAPRSAHILFALTPSDAVQAILRACEVVTRGGEVAAWLAHRGVDEDSVLDAFRAVVLARTPAAPEDEPAQPAAGLPAAEAPIGQLTPVPPSPQ